MSFVYSVKFIYGKQDLWTPHNPCLTVRSGYYSTDISIHNFHPVGPPAVITKHLLLLVHNDVNMGREPRFVAATDPPFANITLPPGAATMDDGCSLFGPVGGTVSWAGHLQLGVLVLQSTVSLNVTAVYTVTDLSSPSISIDVQSINERQV